MQDAESRMLLFIASCFGGILLAKVSTTNHTNGRWHPSDQALNFASSPHNEYEILLQSTIGIVFLGTPFGDSHALALKGAQIRRLVSSYCGKETSDSLIGELEPGQKMGFVESFGRLLTFHKNSILTTCFYETRKTDISKVIPNLPQIVRSALKQKTLVQVSSHSAFVYVIIASWLH